MYRFSRLFLMFVILNLTTVTLNRALKKKNLFPSQQLHDRFQCENTGYHLI